MARVASVTIKSNAKEILSALDEQVNDWLRAVGEDAAGTAADTSVAPVDTGLLKNSITYAIAGEAPNIIQYRADKGGETGSYSGTAPEANMPTVYIGTNVEYAIYQEFGTSRGVRGRHFIQYGATAHKNEYKALLEQYLSD